jgi:hypothetical protein
MNINVSTKKIVISLISLAVLLITGTVVKIYSDDIADWWKSTKTGSYMVSHSGPTQIKKFVIFTYPKNGTQKQFDEFYARVNAWRAKVNGKIYADDPKFNPQGTAVMYVYIDRVFPTTPTPTPEPKGPEFVNVDIPGRPSAKATPKVIRPPKLPLSTPIKK